MRSILDMMKLRQIPRGTMKLLALEESFFDGLNLGEVNLDLSQFPNLQQAGFREEKGFGPYTAVLTREQNGEMRYKLDLYDERKQNEPNLPRFLMARKSFSSPEIALKNYIALVQHLPKLSGE